MRRSPLRLFLLALAAFGLVLALHGEAQAATPRVRHQTGCCWVWFGPANYHGGGGAYGITITGPGGAVLDTGFSSTICANGANWNASVTNYFRAKRQGLTRQGFQLLTASNITHPNQSPQTYRRQRLTWRRTLGGVVKRGEFEFDYDFTTNVDGVNYCYARNLGLYSNQGVWAQRRPTLVNINQSLAYSGPGACTPTASVNC